MKKLPDDPLDPRNLGLDAIQVISSLILSDGRAFEQIGKEMTYHQLCMYIKKKADSSPRILNLIIDHVLGKPPEQVQQEQVVIMMNLRR